MHFWISAIQRHLSDWIFTLFIVTKYTLVQYTFYLDAAYLDYDNPKPLIQFHNTKELSVIESISSFLEWFFNIQINF